MAGRMAGKVAFVTGAARGQGRAHCVRLAEEGADVIAVDLCEPVRGVPYPGATKEDLDETVRLVEARDRRIHAVQVDVRDRPALGAAVDAGVAELGRLDGVVVNHGITIMRPWDQVTPEIFDDTIGVNLVGAWNSVMAAAPHVVASGGGSIVLTSSVAGLKGLPFLVPYVASKFAVTGMARAFAAELGKDGVRVNSIHPTSVDTAMSMHSSATKEAREAMDAALAGNPHLGGMYGNLLGLEVTSVDDIADAVLFLLSDESRVVTGVAMPVDAGCSAY
jgi:SDR family mycofactocin-dependent oxidoreductase